MDHDHAVCSSKTENHIHKKDVDCNLHLLKQVDSFLAQNHLQIKIYTVYLKNSVATYQYLKNHNQLSFSLRGPPSVI